MRRGHKLLPIGASLLVAIGGLSYIAITADWHNAPDQVTAVATLALAFATVILAVAAVLQDVIRGWLQRPELNASIVLAPPDCHKVPMTIRNPTTGDVVFTADCYYFRLRVRNDGNERAEKVEVRAAELTKKIADGSFTQVKSFLPMDLRWSHLDQLDQPFLEALSPGMERHCDLGHVIHPMARRKFAGEDNPQLAVGNDKTIFSFDLEVKSNLMTHLIAPGDYRLAVLIAAANTKPVKKNLQIVLTGDWYDDESKMLSEGISIKTI